MGLEEGHALLLVVPHSCVTWAPHLTSLVKGETETGQEPGFLGFQIKLSSVKMKMGVLTYHCQVCHSYIKNHILSTLCPL